MVELLLRKLPLYHLGSACTNALQWATRDIPIMKQLLAAPDVHPEINNNLLLYDAVSNSQPDLVQTLLTHPAVNVTDHDHHVILMAALHDEKDILKMLLLRSKDNSDESHQYSLDIAIRYGCEDVVREVHPDFNTASLVESASGTTESDTISSSTLDAFYDDVLNNRSRSVIDRLANNPTLYRDVNFSSAFEIATLNMNYNVFCALHDSTPHEALTYRLAFEAAARSDLCEFIWKVLEHPGFDPSFHNNAALQSAAYNNSLAVAQILLAYPSVVRSLHEPDHDALRSACRNNHREMVRLLLRYYTANSNTNPNIAYELAIAGGFQDIVDDVLRTYAPHTAISQDTHTVISEGTQPNGLVLHAVQSNDEEELRRLLSTHTLSQSSHIRPAAFIACRHGHLPIVQALIEHDADRSLLDPNPLVLAAILNNHIAVVEFLARLNGFDVKLDDYRVFRIACEYGRVEIVRFFLTSFTIDAGIHHNYAIRRASYNGHPGVVSLLLHESSVDPCDMDNLSIKDAFRLGHNRIVELLIEDGRATLPESMRTTQPANAPPIGTSPQLASKKRMMLEVTESDTERDESQVFTCPICLDKKKNLSIPPCNHAFCTGCLKQSLKQRKQCPKCRKRCTTHARLYL